MTRYFCDICGDEVEVAQSQREFTTFLTVPNAGSEVKVQLSRAINGTWNAGHICNECLANALSKIKEQLYDERDAGPNAGDPS